MRYLIFLLLLGLFPGIVDNAPVTIYLAGDSTMAEKQHDKRPETGWGEVLQHYFDPADVRVENHARNGRSTVSFIEEGRWQIIVDKLQAGDYVFIQFGHNDQKENSDRYASPQQYGDNLIRFVRDVRAKKATPVLLTPVVRRRFDDNGQFYDTHGEYPDAVRRVATEQNTPLIDMHHKSRAILQQYGAERSKRLFLLLAAGEYPNYPNGLNDNTHFSARGANVMAKQAVDGIYENDLNLVSFLQSAMPPAYNAIVDASYTGSAGALVASTPTFNTIGAALAAVPENNETPFVVFIRQGRYYEKLSIDRPFIHLIGESQERTILTFDNSASTPGLDGKALGTSGSFTLRITAPDFHAENLTIENGFDYPANKARPDGDPAKMQSPQAVALLTTAKNDRAVFRNCTIIGYQDTLFINSGRHYFHHCRILGHVDFIFGAGQAVFDASEIVSRNRVAKDPTGYVTAPSTPISFPYGFLFVDSRFVKETPDLPAGSVRLGRPWHPGSDLRANGNAVFMHCYMDDHIGPIGYAPISGRNEAGERIWFDLEPGSRFFEYDNYGPGAIKSPERPMLSAREAAWFIPAQVLNGWNPNENKYIEHPTMNLEY
ncbi:MAG: pectinesterase family protein [Rhodothermales bacterium]